MMYLTWYEKEAERQEAREYDKREDKITILRAEEFRI